MQYSAFACTPHVISKGSTCAMKIMKNVRVAMESGSNSVMLQMKTNPDRKVCDNILERRHTPHRLR